MQRAAQAKAQKDRDFVQFVVTTAGIVHVQVGVGALVKDVQCTLKYS